MSGSVSDSRNKISISFCDFTMKLVLVAVFALLVVVVCAEKRKNPILDNDNFRERADEIVQKRIEEAQKNGDHKLAEKLKSKLEYVKQNGGKATLSIILDSIASH